MMKFFSFIFFMVAFLRIEASDLSFDDLGDQEKMISVMDSLITMRGFLYRKDDTWILAAAPNVKSCCVANPNQSTKQVILEGTFSTIVPQSVVAVEGLLTFQPPFYQLKKASLVHSQNKSFPIMTILISSLIVGVVYIFFRKIRSRQ